MMLKAITNFTQNTKPKKMKFIQALLFLILASCTTPVVIVKHPVPNMRRDLNGFNSDLVGEYLITDTIVNEVFFDALNELYNPEIILDTDTSVFITAKMKVVISKHAIISKKVYTGYLFRSLYDAEGINETDNIDAIIFLNDTVKIISKEEVDTLFNIQNQDIVRKYKGQYLLNKWNDSGYQPILLTKMQHGFWKLMDLEEDHLVDYYNSFDHENNEEKANLVYSEEAISLKNSELKDLIRNEYFTVRYTLAKKTIRSIKE